MLHASCFILFLFLIEEEEEEEEELKYSNLKYGEAVKHVQVP